MQSYIVHYTLLRFLLSVNLFECVIDLCLFKISDVEIMYILVKIDEKFDHLELKLIAFRKRASPFK